MSRANRRRDALSATVAEPAYDPAHAFGLVPQRPSEVTVTESTAPRSLRRVPSASQLAYLWVAGPLVLILAIEAAEGTWVADFWLHTAVVNELSRFPFDPPHPFVVGDYPSFYYTPYTLGVALVARLAGLSGATVLGVVGVANLVVLLVALRLWVRCFSARTATPVVALVLVLLLWGLMTWQWSGFINLAGLPLILPYPSTFTTALMLISWVILMRAVARPTLGRLASIAALAWLIVLSHPYTMVNTGLGFVAILISERHRWSARLLVGLGVAAFVAVLLAVAWPYFSLLDELRSTSSADAIHRPLYEHLLERVGVAAIGLPALGWRWQRNRADPLVWLFLLAAAILLVGWLTNHYALGRVWPVLVLPLQLSAAIEITDPPPGAWSGRTIAYAAVVALAVLVGLRGGAGGLVRVLPPSAVSAELRAQLYVIEPIRLPLIEQCVTTDEVVATDSLRALRMLPAFGAKVIVPGYPDAYVPDEARRGRDQDALFNVTTPPDTVSQILARYAVRWVLWDPSKPLADQGAYRAVATQADGLRLLAPIGVPPSGGC